jgi:hypothetical protein
LTEKTGFGKKLSRVVTDLLLGGAAAEGVAEAVRGKVGGEQSKAVASAEHIQEAPAASIAPRFELTPGWSIPRPASLPKPTYTPAVFALGIIFLAFGIVTSYYITDVGAVLFAIGLSKWIGELLNER